MVQFVPIAQGTIYELKPVLYAQEVEAFDNVQAQTYVQQAAHIKQFFGTPDNDVLLVVDTSMIFSDDTRNSILEAAQTFLAQVSPFVNLKVMLVAD